MSNQNQPRRHRRSAFEIAQDKAIADANRYEIKREQSPFGERWIVYSGGRRLGNCPSEKSAQAVINEFKQAAK